MSRTLAVLISLLITGCSQPPKFLADVYDNQDPCQFRHYTGTVKEKTAKMPNWCYGSQGKVNIYDTRGKAIGYTKN